MKQKTTIWILLALSAVLMSLPFLVPHCGFFALFGLVPLLCADKIATDIGLKQFWWRQYLCFVLWNAITTFWVCYATVGGGIFASLANAAQMAIIFSLFRLSKKKFKGALPYIFLTAMWIAWERFYFNAQISWPWLTLGNAFARSIGSIQWYEYTGSLGGSLWIWISNLSIFGMMVALGDGRFFERWNAKARVASIAGLVLAVAGPFVLSAIIWGTYQEKEDPMDFLIIQPNIDPYHKFEALSQTQQNEILFKMVDDVLCEREDSGAVVIVAPETFTSDVVVNSLKGSRSYQDYSAMLEKYPNANFLYGASSWSYIQSETAPSYTARKAGAGLWYESHNSAMMIDRLGDASIYHKSRLVVGTEKMPYPKFFSKLDDRLGGVMGRCVGQPSATTLKYRSDDGSKVVPLGSVICYESIYGDYCRGYVLDGAKALVVITNDAWWGDTPGYKQHCSYSSIRAIETRRPVVRCANTGISCLVSQKGEISQPTPWWEPAAILGTVNLNSKQTFFVSHGDIVGRVSTFVFLLLLLALLVRLIIRRK